MTTRLRIVSYSRSCCELDLDIIREEREGKMVVPHAVFYGASGYSYSVVQMALLGFPQPLCEPAAYIDDFRGGCGQTLNGIPIPYPASLGKFLSAPDRPSLTAG